MNPIIKVRKELGMCRGEFANICGVGYTTVQNTEKNFPQKIGNQILKGINRLGYDPEKIKEEYQEFRIDKKRELMGV